MTTRIDELNTRYLIPGMDLGPAEAAAEAEGVEEDYRDAPFSQMPPLGDIPSPTGWQDLLGLNRVPPGPSQIDPPPRPSSLRNWPTVNGIGGPLRFLWSPTEERESGAAVSPKVEQMLGILARYERAARSIRARASEGGAQ